MRQRIEGCRNYVTISFIKDRETVFDGQLVLIYTKMDKRWTVLFCLLLNYVFAQDKSIQDCFREDSISCLQMQLFTKTKTFLEMSSIELISGVTLSTKGSSLESRALAQSVETAFDVESRQRALENYLLSAVSTLWYNRTLRWNPQKIIDTLEDSIPSSMKKQITFVGEGRAKKKQLKMVVPLVIALMLKFAAMVALSYMGIAVIAKKAVVAAVISLVISGFIGVRSLLASNSNQAEVVGYHHPYPDWDSDFLTTDSELAPQRKFFTGHKSS